MGRGEKLLVVFWWCYFAVYICCVHVLFLADELSRFFFYLLPFHLFGMAMGLVMFAILFRDLYRRSFPDRLSKVLWAIVMVLCWPMIFVYLYRHGFRPR